MDGPLSDLRVIEVAMFAPDATGMHLADLGAEVIKVETPGLGDPARGLGVPFRGESAASRRWNRGKHSIAIDLRSEDGQAVFLDLVRSAEVVIEGMRAGALERRGLGYEDLLRVNDRLVFASVTGWGASGPYRELGSHGLAFDAFAGLAPPREVHGRIARPVNHVWQGLEAGPLHAALGIVAAVLRARATGAPCHVEVSQADAGASWNGWRIGWEGAVAERARLAPDKLGSEEAERLDAAIAALESAAEGGGRPGELDLPARDVRYQYYKAADGPVLLMATETKFWRHFCEAVDRPDLFERWPGRAPADHDYDNDALREELARIFATRTRSEWVALFIEHDVAGAPVYTGGASQGDPHFEARELWLDEKVHGLRLVGPPLRIDGDIAVAASPSPGVGQHADRILREVLGYDDARIAAFRSSGAQSESKQEPLSSASGRTKGS
jgi:crotonobetainyl-CoA:carnitine CoA-transferase CaiB-like acyl-CoA transferase